jgi:hypothetical protein
MNQINCPHEASVATAARSGRWEASLQVHAEHCSICREIVAATCAMQSLAQSPESNRILPDAELLWCGALLARKQAEADRARRALALSQSAPGFLIALAFAGWLAWHWSEVQRSLAGFFLGLSPLLRAVGAAPYAGTALLSLLALAILALAVILVAHPLLAED